MEKFAMMSFTKNVSQKFSVAKFLELSFTEEKNSMARHDKNNTWTLFLKTSNTSQSKQHEHWDFASIKLLVMGYKSLRLPAFREWNFYITIIFKNKFFISFLREIRIKFIFNIVMMWTSNSHLFHYLKPQDTRIWL